MEYRYALRLAQRLKVAIDNMDSLGKETKFHRCCGRSSQGCHRTPTLYHVERGHQAKQICLMGIQKGPVGIHKVGKNIDNDEEDKG